MEKRFLFLIPVTIGIASFLLVLGPKILNPMNIFWLQQGDTASYYLGWDFFRNSPWTLPVGLNPSYGLEISNSIVYSDSNPLLAISFKLLRGLLPQPFQYFGLWLLACFVLQSWFGWKLMRLLSGNIFICAFGAGLFTFSPPMLWRLHGNIQHLNLVGHFLILASLYLTFSQNQVRRRLFYWGAIVACATLIHSYLMVMVSLLWVINLTDAKINKLISYKRFILEFFLIITIAVFLLWQAGYFLIDNGFRADGFGSYGLNLLSIFDPGGISHYGLWSYVLPDLPGDEHGHEGFNFLGLGLIFLIPFAFYSLKSNYPLILRSAKKRGGLIILLLFFILFSVSNNIGIGNLNIKYDLYEPLLQGAAVFRASARMFWPVFYVIVFCLLTLTIKKFSAKTAALILAAALFLQIADTSSGFIVVRKKMMAEASDSWFTPLVDPFWKIAGRHFKKVRTIPMPSQGPPLDWKYIAHFAVTYGLKTNAAYLGRVDLIAVKKSQSMDFDALKTGEYERDSLYILDDATLVQASKTIKLDEDLLVKIDGQNILAPGWKKHGEYNSRQ